MQEYILLKQCNVLFLVQEPTMSYNDMEEDT